MRISICAIGKEKTSSLSHMLMHTYLKRIPWNVDIHAFEVKKKLPENALKEQEAELLRSAVPKSAIKVALDETGVVLTSQQFAKKMQQWQERSQPIAFLIGGAAGHCKQLLHACDETLSLGKMTWPHMMVRAMLTEQIYRAYTILHNHPYHK